MSDPFSFYIPFFTENVPFVNKRYAKGLPLSHTSVITRGAY